MTMLSAEERSRNQKALSDVISLKKPLSTTVTAPANKSSGRRRSNSLARQRRNCAINGAKSKSPPQRPQRQAVGKRSHSSKKHKREKHDKIEEKHPSYSHHHHHHALNGTPANHVVSLLVSNIVSSCSDSKPDTCDPFPDNKAFLWTASLLEILADLVLAVPACASAVQKFRLVRGKDRSRTAETTVAHALAGCPSPSKTFMSFLLHTILPQDRWSIKNDQQIWERIKEEESEESEAITAKKSLAFRLNKVSQTSAQLLVALVARPGEG